MKDDDFDEERKKWRQDHSPLIVRVLVVTRSFVVRLQHFLYTWKIDVIFSLFSLKALFLYFSTSFFFFLSSIRSISVLDDQKHRTKAAHLVKSALTHSVTHLTALATISSILQSFNIIFQFQERRDTITLRARQGPGLSLYLIDSQVPEVARGVLGKDIIMITIFNNSHHLPKFQNPNFFPYKFLMILKIIPCLLYFIRCSGNCGTRHMLKYIQCVDN